MLLVVVVEHLQQVRMEVLHKEATGGQDLQFILYLHQQHQHHKTPLPEVVVVRKELELDKVVLVD